MNPQSNKPSRHWLRALLTMLGVALIALAFSGCRLVNFFATFLGTEPHEIVFDPNAVLHETVVLECDQATLASAGGQSPVIDLRSFVLLDDTGNVVPQTEIETRNGSPTYITDFDAGTVTFTGITFQYKIVGQRPSGPLRVYAEANASSVGGLFNFNSLTYRAEVKIRFRAQGEPPALELTALEIVGGPGRLTAISAQRGLPFEVEFTGANFDSTATFKATAMNQTYTAENPQSAGAGKVRATFNLPPDAPCSVYSAYVEKDGVRSARGSFALVAEDFEPVLDGIFPNYAVIGHPVSARLVGAGFRPGTAVVPGAALLPMSIPDSGVASVNLMRATLAPSGAPATGGVRVNSLGRLSAPAPFHVKPTGFSGPRIVAVRPSTIVAEAATQVEIEWQNFRNDQVPVLGAFPDAPLASATVLRNQVAPERNRSVAILTSAPGRTGLYSLAATTPDGLSTNLTELQIEPPNALAPLVKRAQFGSVQRGGAPVTERFFGERLADVGGVDFSSTKIRGVVQPGSQTDTQFDMVITADADAPLTGDVLTTFVARTSGGKRSNPASYIVQLGGGGGALPRLDVISPNYAHPGDTFVSVRITGKHFVQSFIGNGTTLTVLPAGSVTFITTVSEEYIDLSLNVPVGTPLGTLTVQASTDEGASNVMNFHIIDPAIAGPRVSTTIDGFPTRGARSQVQLYNVGSGFSANGPDRLLQLVTFQAFQPVIENARLFSPIESQSTTPADSVVVEFTIRGGSAGSGVLLAIEADGLVSNSRLITPDDRDGSLPLVTHTAVGTITRPAAGQPPAQVQETIFGKNLAGMTTVIFNAAGVTASNVQVASDGKSLTCTIEATATATLTGDQITTFRVQDAGGNNITNAASYLIRPMIASALGFNLRVLALAAALLAAPALRAQLPSGTYRTTAELGAVLLDGRYPLTLEDVPSTPNPIDVPGEIELSTAPNGALTGRIIITGEPIDVKGTMKLRDGYARVSLSGKRGKDRFRLAAKLVGGEFVGDLRIGRTKTACRFDASSSGAAKPECVLMLAVAANGAISGPGTLKLARQQVAVTAKGRIGKKGVVSLAITGPKVSLKTSTGAIAGTTITGAKWTGQGYGALIKGVNLRVVKDP